MSRKLLVYSMILIGVLKAGSSTGWSGEKEDISVNKPNLSSPFLSERAPTQSDVGKSSEAAASLNPTAENGAAATSGAATITGPAATTGAAAASGAATGTAPPAAGAVTDGPAINGSTTGGAAMDGAPAKDKGTPRSPASTKDILSDDTAEYLKQSGKKVEKLF